MAGIANAREAAPGVESSFDDWLLRAYSDDVEAQFYVGVTLAEGIEVPRDLVESVRWYRRAAELGYAPAQYNLADAYLRGLGVDQDFRQAVYWWRKAAQQDYVLAQTNLGRAYYLGIGAARNHERARYWLSRAREQGDVRARALLEDLNRYTEETEGAKMPVPNDRPVWVSGRHVTRGDGGARITGRGVRGRSRPGAGPGADILGVFQSDQPVTVLAVEGDWVQVATGWSSAGEVDEPAPLNLVGLPDPAHTSGSDDPTSMTVSESEPIAAAEAPVTAAIQEGSQSRPADSADTAAEVESLTRTDDPAPAAPEGGGRAPVQEPAVPASDPAPEPEPGETQGEAILADRDRSFLDAIGSFTGGLFEPHDRRPAPGLEGKAVDAAPAPPAVDPAPPATLVAAAPAPAPARDAERAPPESDPDTGFQAEYRPPANIQVTPLVDPVIEPGADLGTLESDRPGEGVTQPVEVAREALPETGSPVAGQGAPPAKPEIQPAPVAVQTVEPGAAVLQPGDSGVIPAPVAEPEAAAPESPDPVDTAMIDAAGPAPAGVFALVEANDNAWLYAQDPGDYTLQLTTVDSADVARDYIRAHNLEQGRYYQTREDGSDLFYVIYGVYPTYSAAEAAIPALPATSPWIRSLGRLQANRCESARELPDPMAAEIRDLCVARALVAAGAPGTPAEAVPVTPAEPRPVPVEKKDAARPPVAPRLANDNAWLFAQSGDGYTIQLISVNTEGEARDFIERHALPEAGYFATRKDGVDWYYVVSGAYPSRAAAAAAARALPIESTWVRNIGSLQSSRCRNAAGLPASFTGGLDAYCSG